MPTITTTAPPQTFAQKCIDSIDAKLAAMSSPEERRDALLRAYAKFLAMSEEFDTRIDGGNPPQWGETAWDYLHLLSDISIRIAREVRQCSPEQ